MQIKSEDEYRKKYLKSMNTQITQSVAIFALAFMLAMLIAFYISLSLKYDRICDDINILSDAVDSAIAAVIQDDESSGTKLLEAQSHVNEIKKEYLIE